MRALENKTLTGTGWIVPLLLSAEIPTACLDLLRMLAEVREIGEFLA